MPPRKSLADKEEAMGTMRNSKGQIANGKLLVLHGWSYSTEKWKPFMKLMEAKGFKPHLLEIPGLTAPIDRTWTLDDYVEWLKDKVGKEKAVLIGHSNGGRIALAFALKYPEGLKHLILIDSAGIYHNELPIRLKRFVFRVLARVGREFTSSEDVKSIFYKVARVNDYKEATPEMRQTMVNLISADLTPNLTRVKAPTLIIWGAKDKTTPLSDGKLMNRIIPNSRFHIVKGARHSPQFTHPEEVCKKIWPFLTL